MLPSTPTTTLSVPTAASHPLPPLPYRHLLPPPRFPCSCSHSLCPRRRSTLCVLLPQPLSPSSQPRSPFHCQPSPLGHSDPSRTASLVVSLPRTPPPLPRAHHIGPSDSPRTPLSPSLADSPTRRCRLSSPSRVPCWLCRTPDPSSPSPSSSHRLGPPPLLPLPCACRVSYSNLPRTPPLPLLATSLPQTSHLTDLSLARTVSAPRIPLGPPFSLACCLVTAAAAASPLLSLAC